MNPTNEPQPSPPLPILWISTNLDWQHELEVNSLLLSREGFDDLPNLNITDPQAVYREVVRAQEQQCEDRAPSWGPSRRASRLLRRNGIRKAEAPNRYKYIPGSSRTILDDRSTGIHPGMAWMDADDDTRIEKTRTTKPYDRDLRKRTTMPLTRKSKSNLTMSTSAPSAPESAETSLTAYMERMSLTDARKDPVIEDDFAMSTRSDTE